jgi:hypothetical protein
MKQVIPLVSGLIMPMRIFAASSMLENVQDRSSQM